MRICGITEYPCPYNIECISCKLESEYDKTLALGLIINDSVNLPANSVSDIVNKNIKE